MSWPLRILRWVYCGVIAWSAAQSFLDAQRIHDTHALILSAAEMIAIAAFLFKSLEIPALAVLLAVFAIAGILHTSADELPLRFLFFAAAAVRFRSF